MRRRVALIAIAIGILVGVGFYVSSHKDYLWSLRGQVIREKHEYYMTDVTQPSGTLYTGPIFAEHITYYFPEADQPRVAAILRQETKKRGWYTGIDRPSETSKHAVFGSTPRNSDGIYMSDPYLLAVNTTSHELCVADVHALSKAQYWLVRLMHPFSNPFPPRKP